MSFTPLFSKPLFTTPLSDVPRTCVPRALAGCLLACLAGSAAASLPGATLSCSGPMDFTTGARTVVSCTADLNIRGGLLQASESLSIQSFGVLSVEADAELSAPQISLTGDSIVFLGKVATTGLVQVGGGSLRLAAGGDIRLSSGAPVDAPLPHLVVTAPLAWTGGVELPAGTLTIASLPLVPEPATAWLATAGLVALGLLQRRRPRC